jgi:hypothetical protein
MVDQAQAKDKDAKSSAKRKAPKASKVKPRTTKRRKK